MTFIRNHDVIILLHDIKKVPMLNKVLGYNLFWTSGGTGNTDPFIKLNTR